MSALNRERALLVGVEAHRTLAGGVPDTATGAAESMEELEVLVRSAGAEVTGRVTQVRSSLDPATLVGSGKVQEIVRLAAAGDVDTVVFDHDLSPTQLRNLEGALECKVLDRTQLILDIFARRARTREGQLQVELAQLNYLLPRLRGRGTEMSRLGGGIGTRGPGETQLETDRRKLARRLRRIREQLAGVRRTRSVQRRQRQGVPLANVALVGYTNAGKSTLFNRLTGAGVTVDSRLFATLDPTTRLLALGSRRHVVLSDTVGFIRNLPTTLVQAFRATLEEVAESALLLHVVDASSPHIEENARHVISVLREIGAAGIPQLLVLNKADQAGDAVDTVSIVSRLGEAGAGAELISALTGQGVDRLLQTLDRALPVDKIVRDTYLIPAGAGAALHLLHEYGVVLSKQYDGDVCRVVAETPERIRRRLREFLAKG